MSSRSSFQERDNHLVQFVIYERPKDFPSGYVVRRWLIGPDRLTPDVATTHDTLAAARRAIPRDMILIARSEGDDPCIVEVWT